MIDRSPIETRTRTTKRTLLPAFNASLCENANLETPVTPGPTLAEKSQLDKKDPQ